MSPSKSPALDVTPQKRRKPGESGSNTLALIHVGFTFILVLVLEGSHQEYIDKSHVSWWLWLLFMGILQGGPLRQGLPIHLFLIYPHIVRVSVGSQVCSSLLFQSPPYPDVIKCPELQEPKRPNILQILAHLFPELLSWSLGTLIMNFIFFKIYRKVPNRDVAVNAERIQALVRNRWYYQGIEALAKTYRHYFTLSPLTLVLQDADISAAQAGLNRSSTSKFIKDSLIYPILVMNILLTPGLICIAAQGLRDPGPVVQGLLSIDASDAVYTPDETAQIKALKTVRDTLYYGLAAFWLWLFMKQNTAK